MPGLLASGDFFEHYADELSRLEGATSLTLEHLILPTQGRVEAEMLPRIELAYSPPAFRKPAVPKPSHQETPESSAYPILSGMSRPR